MSGITVKIDAEKYIKFLDMGSEKVKIGINKGIQAGAFLIEREAKRLIAGGYFKHPTGRLMNSISRDLYDMRAEIAPHVYYARFVHDGTRYIRPHPFMKDTAEANAEKVEKLIEDYVRLELQ